ncbi:unnamed protein product [Haemonchus placei]|uniref:TRP domain-containing protein n=1 Tax=Haemonchus placei TaxID=6290 RepID=A0A0N4X1G8_HAEPC|nr:unnamed protein product [Haemonchus placei]
MGKRYRTGEEKHRGFMEIFIVDILIDIDFRSPYMISRRQYDDDYSDYYRDFKAQSRDYDRRVQTYQQAIYFIRVMAYIQIFIAGVLLVSDVSRIVLLWTFVQSASTIIEMICQLSFPLFSLILGFLSLTSALSPSSVISKSVAILLIAAIVPNFVFPKQAAFITLFLKRVAPTLGNSPDWKTQLHWGTDDIAFVQEMKKLEL